MGERARVGPCGRRIRRYAVYHGITEEESHALLERYGLLEDIKDNAFSYEYNGTDNEVGVLRSMIEEAGGTNPPPVAPIDRDAWGRTLGSTAVSTETVTEDGTEIVRMNVRQGSREGRIDMYPDGSVEVVAYVSFFLPLSRTAVAAFMEEWSRRFSDREHSTEGDRSHRGEACPDL